MTDYALRRALSSETPVSLTQHLCYYAARAFVAVYRLNTLRIARRVFSRATAGELLRRKLFGSTIVLDVSRSNPQKLLWLVGERFISEKNLVRQLVSPNAHIIDVGANIGYYALMFHSFLKSSDSMKGHVFCIEPDPSNHAELRATIRESNLDRSISVLFAAAGNSDGSVRFEPGLNGIVNERGSIEVPVMRIDSLKLDRVDLIKVDVEGYEGAVLEGAMNLIAKFRPNMFLELHPQLLTGHTHAGILDLLQKYYQNVEIYVSAENRGVRRAAEQYGLVPRFTRLFEPAALFEKFRYGVIHEPCWVVARHP